MSRSYQVTTSQVLLIKPHISLIYDSWRYSFFRFYFLFTCRSSVWFAKVLSPRSPSEPKSRWKLFPSEDLGLLRVCWRGTRAEITSALSRDDKSRRAIARRRNAAECSRAGPETLTKGLWGCREWFVSRLRSQRPLHSDRFQATARRRAARTTEQIAIFQFHSIFNVCKKEFIAALTWYQGLSGLLCVSNRKGSQVGVSVFHCCITDSESSPPVVDFSWRKVKHDTYLPPDKSTQEIQQRNETCSRAARPFVIPPFPAKISRLIGYKTPRWFSAERPPKGERAKTWRRRYPHGWKTIKRR